ncbi:MAG: cytochrome C oxidase subunit IV family protein [Bdellovibrionales bacterium]|jgi:cytochrome c oxidase subunit IV|nr:cytochrome C oxidase subunit IV family protein [Bdellovibrionales bacterium]
MTESITNKSSHRKGYFIVFAVLAILTILELAIPSLDVKYFYRASSLTLLAFAKAFVVAYYYMHLNEETAWLKFIAIIPISAGFYAAVLILETIFR